jgi:putative ABC transport system permease protein
VILLKRAVPEARAPRWLVLATRQIAARPAFAVLQVSALSVGLLALVLLVLLRTDLISSWRQATPKDAPDRFVINVQPEQSEAFRQRLADAGVKRYDWFPMIRGRLVMVNGKPVKPDDLPDERARRLLDREFNLSHSSTMPEHNVLVAGRWQPDEANAVSVEEGIAQTLGLKMGDVLRFDIGGAVAEGRITTLRKVDWSSMRVNFFVMFPDRDDGRRARELHRRVPRARAARRPLRQRAAPRLPEHHQRSTCRPRSRRSSACSTRSCARSSSCSASRSRPGWWCCSPPSPPRARRARASSR